MLTRRKFLSSTLAGIGAAGAATTAAWGAGRLAWPHPIGLEIYTVRQLYAQNPAETLKKVAAVGYKEVEIAPYSPPDVMTRDLRAAGLSAPSGYFDVPKNLDPDWKKTLQAAQRYGVRYIVVGDNPKLSADAWRRRADLFNQCGKLAREAGIQFCYHAHYHEFATVDHTCGYDIMLERCDPKYLKMEMDIFWVTYAGKDPLTYWRRYPGRFPLLHIKDLKKGIHVNPQGPPSGPNPFVPVGQGRIDWRRIFAHVGEAGVKHIFVEQDHCDQPPLDAIRISYNYLKNLRLS